MPACADGDDIDEDADAALIRISRLQQADNVPDRPIRVVSGAPAR
jgi:hypothetical protein